MRRDKLCKETSCVTTGQSSSGLYGYRSLLTDCSVLRASPKAHAAPSLMGSFLSVLQPFDRVSQNSSKIQREFDDRMTK